MSNGKRRQEDEVTNQQAEEELASEGRKQRSLWMIQAEHAKTLEKLGELRKELLQAGKLPDSGQGSGVNAAAFDPLKEIDEPSKLTTYPEWKPYQFNTLNQPRWKCYRGPKEAEPKVPLVLLHESFEAFCRDIHRCELEDIDFELAETIWETFTMGAEDELTEVTIPLNVEFETYLDTTVQCEIPGVCKTDGFLAYNRARGMAGMEDKRQGADGIFKLLEYFRKVFRANLLRRCRISHAIGLLRVLPSLQFVAVVMEWDKRDPDDPSGNLGTLMAEPLTDPISCWGPKNLGLPKVARALRAFKNFVKSYKPETFINSCIPSLLKDWTDVKHLRGELNQDSLIFYGRDPVSGTVSPRVAKFCTTYSESAHKAWADLSLAPALYQVTNLHSGWKCVVMEYLSAQDGWEALDDVTKRYTHNKAVLKSLHTAIKSVLVRGHEAGFVHGDFRFPNIFAREPRYMRFDLRAVGFDWAGPVGEAYYPQCLSPSHQWHPAARLGKLIQKEHDHVFIDRFALRNKLLDES